MRGEFINVLARVEFKTAKEIANLATELYVKEKIDAVYIIFSEFKSVMASNLTVEKLLPIEKTGRSAGRKERSSRRRTPNARKVQASRDSAQIDYIYEQPPEHLLGKLLPRYVETQVLRAMLESSASEYAARMTAMEAATKNAGEVIEASDTAHEQSTSGGDHHRNHRNCQRRELRQIGERMAEKVTAIGHVVQVIGPVLDIRI